MKTKWWLASVLATMMICQQAWAQPQEEEAVTIVAYNRALIGNQTLNQAEHLASRLFSRAAVRITWLTHSWSEPTRGLIDFSPASPAGCAQPLTSTTLKMQFLPTAPRGFPPAALAYSLSCSAFGIQVTIFSDRVEAVSRNSDVDSACVLGYTIVHEAGHVILRSSVHTATGLMKGTWTIQDWKRASHSTMTFDREESHLMIDQLRHARWSGSQQLAVINPQSEKHR